MEEQLREAAEEDEAKAEEEDEAKAAEEDEAKAAKEDEAKAEEEDEAKAEEEDEAKAAAKPAELKKLVELASDPWVASLLLAIIRSRSDRSDDDDGDGYSGGKSIDQFCADWNISRSLFYKLRAKGQAPDVTPFGDTPRISRAAERRWAQAREKRQAGEAA